MKGKAQVTREKERERKKVRRKKASGVAAPFISFTRVPPVL